jgi:hypothetical protein
MLAFRSELSKLIVILSAIVSSSLGQSVEAKGTVADSMGFENAYVKVVRNAAGCPRAHTPGFGDRVIVALGPLSVEGDSGIVRLERGGVAVFQENESYTPPAGEFFEVAFKTDHPPVAGPKEWLEPHQNQVVHDGPSFRVFEERLEGGGVRELHSHAQRVVVRLNEVQLTDPRFQRKERPGAGVQVPNTVRFAEPIVHVVKNLSVAPLFNIVIELKPSATR